MTRPDYRAFPPYRHPLNRWPVWAVVGYLALIVLMGVGGRHC